MKGSVRIMTHGDTLQIPGGQMFRYVHLVEIDREASGVQMRLGERWQVSQRVLGTGSWAAVLLGTDLRTGVQVACKRQSTQLLESSNDAKMIQMECELLKRLSHPNISKIFAEVVDEESIYFMMDLVCGGDLFSYVCLTNGRLMDAEAKFVFYQLAQAVSYLHGNGIAHRDVKPENILLLNYSRFPRIQLADFGLAAELHCQPPRSRSVCGTLIYSSKEAISNRITGEAYDPRGLDTYAMGVVLALMLIGRHPFDFGDAVDHDRVTFQIQQYLLNEGVIDQSWIQRHGIQGDEELEDMSRSAAELAHLGSAKQKLVNRLMKGAIPNLQEYACADGEPLRMSLVSLEASSLTAFLSCSCGPY